MDLWLNIVLIVGPLVLATYLSTREIPRKTKIVVGIICLFICLCGVYGATKEKKAEEQEAKEQKFYRPLLEEIYLCMRHLKIPYSDVLLMPTYERRFFLTSFIQENEKRKEQIENQQMNSSNGSGTRTTKISGEQLKTKMRNGEIS